MCSKWTFSGYFSWRDSCNKFYETQISINFIPSRFSEINFQSEEMLNEPLEIIFYASLNFKETKSRELDQICQKGMFQMEIISWRVFVISVVNCKHSWRNELYLVNSNSPDNTFFVLCQEDLLSRNVGCGSVKLFSKQMTFWDFQNQPCSKS